MKKVLIFSVVHDYHAIAVEWGLRQLGVDVHYWCSADLPDHSTVSVDFSGAAPEIIFTDGTGVTPLSDVGFFWNRRLGQHQAPANAHADDHEIIERQCKEFTDNLRALISDLVFTVNDPKSQWHADRKMVQINVAKQVGFAVKPTLIGNDFSAVTNFAAEPGAFIHKSLRFHYWREGAGAFNAYTAVTPSLGDEDRLSVEYCPMIYQERIRHEFEVRVICFGDFMLGGACAMSKESHPDLRKSMRERTARFFRIDIPEEIAIRIRAYMTALNLRYGAFDFVVDEEGGWWFLECNESGQSLYLEQAIPDAGILAAFCGWIYRHVSGGQEADAATLRRISTRSFEQGRQGLFKSNMQLHKESARPIRRSTQRETVAIPC